MVKGNIISYIGDGVTSLLRIKDYYVFNDSWITEHDKVLFDNDGNTYNVLDYQEVEDYVCDTYEETEDIQYPINSWRWVKRTCLKLDREAKIGDILYIKQPF